NTYARLEKLFLKLFMEEEDLHVYLLVDASQSMAFGEPAKFDVARRVAAALGYIALTNYDRVGAALLGDRVRDSLSPVRGRGQVFPFFQFLERTEAAGPTGLGAALRDFALRTRRTGVAILISDFLDPSWEEGLKALVFR